MSPGAVPDALRSRMRRSLWRLVNVLRPGRAEDELARETAAHLALLEAEFQRRGMNGEDARLAAKRAFGGIEQMKDRHRDARSFTWLDDARRDVYYATRTLRKTPGFTAAAVLTLALGIAATTTVFGWIDGMVLHPFRGATDDGQLAVLESVRASGIEDPHVSYADSRDFQDSLRSISGLALNEKAPASIGDGENAYSAWIESVSGNYFDVLGVKPILGRVFTREEYGDKAKAFTAVISYRLWQNYFRGDRSVLGRTVHINRYPVTIV